MDFSYICKNLAGSAASGTGSGEAVCALRHKTGPHCTPANAGEGKAACPHADYLKILAPKKKRW